MTDDPPPYGADRLGDAGRSLYDSIYDEHGHYLGLHELCLLLEAARCADRLRDMRIADASETGEFRRIERPGGGTIILAYKNPAKLSYAAVKSMTRSSTRCGRTSAPASRPQRRGGSRSIYTPR